MPCAMHACMHAEAPPRISSEACRLPALPPCRRTQPHAAPRAQPHAANPADVQPHAANPADVQPHAANPADEQPHAANPADVQPHAPEPRQAVVPLRIRGTVRGRQLRRRGGGGGGRHALLGGHVLPRPLQVLHPLLNVCQQGVVIHEWRHGGHRRRFFDQVERRAAHRRRRGAVGLRGTERGGDRTKMGVALGGADRGLGHRRGEAARVRRSSRHHCSAGTAARRQPRQNHPHAQKEEASLTPHTARVGECYAPGTGRQAGAAAAQAPRLAWLPPPPKEAAGGARRVGRQRGVVRCWCCCA